MRILEFVADLFSAPYVYFVRVRPSRYKYVAIKLSSANGAYGFALRRAFYRATLNYCGKGLNVHYGAFICYPTVKIGNNVTIEEYSIVGRCEIGDDSILAARVSVMSGAHHHDISDLGTLFRNSTGSIRSVAIGKNVWIGTHAVVMNDVGDHSVVASAAVVVAAAAEYSVLAGCPAKLIRDRRQV